MTSVILLFLLLIGVALYFAKPKLFFLYWMGIQPYILPVFFFLFEDSLMPLDENYLPNLYFHYPNTLCSLMLLLFCVSYAKNNNRIYSFKIVMRPLSFLVLFLIIQNFVVGFRVGTLYANLINVLWNIAPFLLLLIDKRVRPSRDSFIHFVACFVYIQLFFCTLNLFGIRLYGEVTGIFDDSLICGTFARYNHMTNYLSIFFFVFSYEYYVCRRISPKLYYLMAFLIGLLIVLSGSRMNFILFAFTAYFFFCILNGKKTVITLSLIFLSLFGTYVINNDKFYGQEADDGTGLERNVIGIIDLANSDDLSEGSTLSLSVYLLMDLFESPIIGNGKAYRGGDNFYGHPKDILNEVTYRTDARLAFMLVDYGVVGLFLFLLLFVSLYRYCFLYSKIKNKYFYGGAFLYFVLFSLTDNGFWDYLVFSILFVYAFSVENEKKLIVPSPVVK